MSQNMPPLSQPLSQPELSQVFYNFSIFRSLLIFAILTSSWFFVNHIMVKIPTFFVNYRTAISETTSSLNHKLTKCCHKILLIKVIGEDTILSLRKLNILNLCTTHSTKRVWPRLLLDVVRSHHYRHTWSEKKREDFAAPIAPTAKTSAAKPLVYYVVWLILSLFFLKLQLT